MGGEAVIRPLAGPLLIVGIGLLNLMATPRLGVDDAGGHAAGQHSIAGETGSAFNPPVRELLGELGPGLAGGAGDMTGMYWWNGAGRPPAALVGNSAAPLDNPASHLSPQRIIAQGWATWYAEEGKITRSGELYDPRGYTCAVAWQKWLELRGQPVLVSMEDGRQVEVVVNDTGRLQEAGLYQGLPFVVDLPRDTFRRYLAEDGDTVQVMVAMIGADNERGGRPGGEAYGLAAGGGGFLGAFGGDESYTKYPFGRRE